MPAAVFYAAGILAFIVIAAWPRIADAWRRSHELVDGLPDAHQAHPRITPRPYDQDGETT